MAGLKDNIQTYLNRVQWSTITRLAEKFNITRHDVTTVLIKLLADQDVRVYNGEIVHV